MSRILCSAALACLLASAPVHAAMTTTAELVAVAPGGPGTFSFSVGGWVGGGVATGSFSGTDTDANGQLSFFDGEITGFSVSYSGGAIVAPIALGFGNLFGLVYDLDGGPLGDGLLLDVEGIGAINGAVSFRIGPGPVGVCGAGVVCGIIEGPAAVVSEAPALALALGGLVLMAGLRRRSV